MYYHASPTGGIEQLEPRISNHGVPLIYFSRKRENVLVYLSNAIERYCRQTGFSYAGTWQKWGPYGFNKEGIQRLEEYYPDALEKTYKGVSGYIYSAEEITDSGFEIQIPDAATSSEPVRVSGVEFVPDAYEAILEAERKGLIEIMRYSEMSDRMREWNRRTIIEEYEAASDHPEYRHFLKGNFPEILNPIINREVIDKMATCYFTCEENEPGAQKFTVRGNHKIDIFVVRRECPAELYASLSAEVSGWTVREFYSEDDDHGDAFRYYDSDTIFHDVTVEDAIVTDGAFVGAFFRNKATDSLLPVMIGEDNYVGRVDRLSETHDLSIQSQGHLMRKEEAGK